jgi:mono/diheme cytochrome c family protein
MNQRLKPALVAICALLCGLCLSTEARSQALPDGKGKTEFVDNCLDCHRAEMVVRVKKTPEEWRKNVTEMAARGSQGTKEDLDNVVLYLDTYFSTNSAPAATTQSTTPSSTSDTEHAKHVIAANGCLTCHRIEQQGAYTAPTLNGIGTHRSPDEIRAAIISHPTPNPANPTPSYASKLTAEDLDSLVRYLALLPPLPENTAK